MSSLQSKRDFVQISNKSISFGTKACFRFIEPKLNDTANKATQDESPQSKNTSTTLDFSPPRNISFFKPELKDILESSKEIKQPMQISLKEFKELSKSQSRTLKPSLKATKDAKDSRSPSRVRFAANKVVLEY